MEFIFSSNSEFNYHQNVQAKHIEQSNTHNAINQHNNQLIKCRQFLTIKILFVKLTKRHI